MNPTTHPVSSDDNSLPEDRNYDGFLNSLEKEINPNAGVEEDPAQAAVKAYQQEVLKRVVRNTRSIDEEQYTAQEVFFAIGYAIDEEAKRNIYVDTYHQLFKGSYVYLLGRADPPIELREDVQKVLNASVETLTEDLRLLASGQSPFCPFLAEQKDAWDTDPVVWPAAVMFSISLVQAKDATLQPSLETRTELLLRINDKFVPYDRDTHAVPSEKPKILQI